MSKSIKSHKSSEKEIILEALFHSAENMSGQNPVATFINGLLTESEKLTLGRRILIAQMILAGKTRMEICNTLQVSPNTVALARQWLGEQLPNYAEMITKRDEIATSKRSTREQKRKQTREFIDPLSFRGIRKKYPAHFLLFNLAEELINRIGK